MPRLRRALPHQVPPLLRHLRPLRAERTDHRRAQHPDGELDPWGRQIDETTVLFIGEWHYAGTGYAASDAHFLALMSANNARAN